MLTKIFILLLILVALFNEKVSLAGTAVVAANGATSESGGVRTAQGNEKSNVQEIGGFEDEDDEESDGQVLGTEGSIDGAQATGDNEGHSDHSELDEDLLHHNDDDDSNLQDDDNQLDALDNQRELGSLPLSDTQIKTIAEKVRKKARKDLGQATEENKDFSKKYRTYIARKINGKYRASEKFTELLNAFTSGNYKSVINAMSTLEQEGFATVDSTGKPLAEITQKPYLVFWSGNVGAGRVCQHAHMLQSKTKVNTYCLSDLYNFKLVLNTINVVRKELIRVYNYTDVYYNNGHWARIVLICRKYYAEIGRRMKSNFILILYENAYVFYNSFDIHLFPLIEKALQDTPKPTLDVIMAEGLDTLDAIDINRTVSKQDAVPLKKIIVEERPIAIEFHQIDRCRTKFNGSETIRNLFATNDSVPYPAAFLALNKDLNYDSQKCIKGRPIFFKNATREYVAVVSNVGGQNDELLQYQVLIGPHHNYHHFFSTPGYLLLKLASFFSESDASPHADALQRYVGEISDNSVDAKRERIEASSIEKKNGASGVQVRCNSIRRSDGSSSPQKCKISRKKTPALSKNSDGVVVATTYTRYVRALKTRVNMDLVESPMERVAKHLAKKAVKFLKHGRTISTSFGLLSGFKIVLHTRTSSLSGGWGSLKQFELSKVDWEGIKNDVVGTFGTAFDGVDLLKASIGRRRNFFQSLQKFSKVGGLGTVVNVIGGTTTFLFEMAKAIQANSGIERALHIVEAASGLADAALSAVTFVSSLAGKLAVLGGPIIISVVVLVFFSSLTFAIRKAIESREKDATEYAFKWKSKQAFNQPWYENPETKSLTFSDYVMITVVDFEQMKLRTHVLVESNSTYPSCSRNPTTRYPKKRSLQYFRPFDHEDDTVAFVLPSVPRVIIADKPSCYGTNFFRRGRYNMNFTTVDIIMGQTGPKVLIVPPVAQNNPIVSSNFIEHVFHGGGTVHKIQLTNDRNIKIDDNHQNISTWIIDTKDLLFPLHGYAFNPNYINFYGSSSITIVNPLKTKLIVHDRDGGVFQLYNGEVRYAPMINYDRIVYTHHNIIEKVVRENKFHDKILIINQYMVNEKLRNTFYTSHPSYFHYTDIIPNDVDQGSTLISTTGTDSYFFNSQIQSFWFNPEDIHIPACYYQLEPRELKTTKINFKKTSLGVEMILETNDFFQAAENSEVDKVHLYTIWNAEKLTLRAINASQTTYDRHIKAGILTQQILKDKLETLSKKFRTVFIDKMSIEINALLTIIVRKPKHTSTFKYIKTNPWTFIQHDINGSDLPDDFTYAGRIFKSTPEEKFIFYSTTKHHLYHIEAQAQNKQIYEIRKFPIQKLYSVSIVHKNVILANAEHVNYQVDISNQTLTPVSITDLWFDSKPKPSEMLRELMVKSEVDTLPIIRVPLPGKYEKPWLNSISGFYIQDEDSVAVTLNLDNECHFVGYLQQPLLAVAFCPRVQKLKALPIKSLPSYRKIIKSNTVESQVPVKPLGNQSWAVKEVKMEDDRFFFNTIDGIEAELLSDRQIKIIGYNNDAKRSDAELKSILSGKCQDHICRDAIHITVNSEVKKWFHNTINQFYENSEGKAVLIGTSRLSEGPNAKLIMYQPSRKAIMEFSPTSASKLVEVDDVIVKDGVINIYGSTSNPTLKPIVVDEYNKMMIIAKHPEALITLDKESLNHYRYLEIMSGTEEAVSRLTVQLPADWESKLSVDYDENDLSFIDENGFTIYLNLQTDYSIGDNTIIKTSGDKEVNAKALIAKFKENDTEFNLAEYLATV